MANRTTLRFKSCLYKARVLVKIWSTIIDTITIRIKIIRKHNFTDMTCQWR